MKTFTLRKELNVQFHFMQHAERSQPTPKKAIVVIRETCVQEVKNFHSDFGKPLKNIK